MFGISTIKLVIIGLIAAAIIGYIAYLKIEVINYKAQATKYEAAYNQIITEQNAALVALQTKEQAQDAARQIEAAESAKTIAALKAANLKAINENTAFKSVVIPNLARQLFNSTITTPSGSDQKGTTGQANSGDATSSSTLADLLTANEKNKAEYLLCQKAKAAWNVLWNQTMQDLNGSP